MLDAANLQDSRLLNIDHRLANVITLLQVSGCVLDSICGVYLCKPDGLYMTGA